MSVASRRRARWRAVRPGRCIVTQRKPFHRSRQRRKNLAPRPLAGAALAREAAAVSFLASTTAPQPRLRMTTTAPTTTLERHGLRHSGTAFWNLAPAALYEEAVRRGEATVAMGGALCVVTTPHTGRSPGDKFVVKEPASEQT